MTWKSGQKSGFKMWMNDWVMLRDVPPDILDPKTKAVKRPRFTCLLQTHTYTTCLSLVVVCKVNRPSILKTLLWQNKNLTWSPICSTGKRDSWTTLATTWHVRDTLSVLSILAMPSVFPRNTTLATWHKVKLSVSTVVLPSFSILIRKWAKRCSKWVKPTCPSNRHSRPTQQQPSKATWYYDPPFL